MNDKFITAYGEKRKSQSVNTEPSMTKQSMKSDCDINFILTKFQKTGMIEHRKEYQGTYGEFAAIDYQEALNTVIQAQEVFESIPSSVRKRFDNDPGKFLDYATNPENLEDMRAIGLANPLPPAEPNNVAGEALRPEPPGETQLPS